MFSQTSSVLASYEAVSYLWDSAVTLEVDMSKFRQGCSSNILGFEIDQNCIFICCQTFGSFLPRFAVSFLFMNCRGANFAWACLITSSDRWHNFFLKWSHSSDNGKTGFFCFYQSGRNSKHIGNMLDSLSGGIVAHCFTLLDNVRYRKSVQKTTNR